MKEDEEVEAIVIANVDPRKLNSAATALLQFDEIRKIYVTTGESNLTIEITTKTLKSFHEFLTSKVSKIEGLSVASSNMVTQTIKSEDKTMSRFDPRQS